MSTPKKSSLELFRLRKTINALASKEGNHTELITIYVPPDKQISDALNLLRNEYGTATNIKSNVTRKNVLDAIVKAQQKLKLFKDPGEKGIVIFTGALPQEGGGPGTERMESFVIVPPEPIKIFLYRCDSRFHTEHLQEMLREKETYGILLVDASDATIATLQGKRLDIIRQMHSGVAGKTRAGGQSARRYERLRDMQLNEYFMRVGNHANEIFLPIDTLKGIIIGGPGPTKYDFEKGDYLNYQLKNKIIDILDTAYVEEQGVKEVVDKAPEIMKKVRYIEEKEIMQKFLYEVGHDSGFITYGEAEVRRLMNMGAVRLVLLSEDTDLVRVTVKCSACNTQEEHTIKYKDLADFEKGLIEKPCSSCKAPSLTIVDKKDLVDDLADLSQLTNTEVEVISTETEEGQMLKNAFGGIAAMLRFKIQN
ncbi:peptide chain release factor aRF-1 [Candidatus Bathycorpusculum sp.]|uniref:peptide chain release factor aRF-1 n=1 Tax=Candidatus Bathycorpusculum sp. TaxID=2994959 RepID=UPI0028364419|nr:peptide chain release factor aRF-1 [Candidatus Termitimicrobium sp.]MCL2431877.1 peptide chain release factor aRF-1 [Candidatus Termitimicrobium sp.]